MKLDAKKIIRERQRKAWSQQHLAQVSGLSLRTIQRVENNGTGSMETVKSLAASFEIKVDTLYVNNANLTKADQSEVLVKNTKVNTHFLSVTSVFFVLVCYVVLQTPISFAAGVEVSAKQVTFNAKEGYVEYGKEVSISIPAGVTFEIIAEPANKTVNESVFIIKLPKATLMAHQIKVKQSQSTIVIEADYAKYYKTKQS